MAVMTTLTRSTMSHAIVARGGIVLPSRLVRTLAPAPRFGPTSLSVRCEASGEDGYVSPFDSATKKTITKEGVLKHQATDESEQRSIFGEKPTSGSPYGRSELERRPETGGTSPWSILAFDGAAPETINGRLAMLGFAWAVLGEKITGLSVTDQVFCPGSTGLIWFLASVQIVTYGSLVPIFNSKESTDARSFGPFTAMAERWNGRAAMIGFASLVATELLIQGPLFVRLFNSGGYPQ